MRERLMLAGWAFVVACGDASDPVELQRSIEVPVEAGDYLFETAIDPPELQYIDLSQESELMRRAIALDAIDSVIVSEFSVRATEGDLDWLSSAELRVRAPDLGTHRVASIDDFPSDATSVAWGSESGAEITALATTGSTSIWVNMVGDSPPADTKLRVEFSLLVHAQ